MNLHSRFLSLLTCAAASTALLTACVATTGQAVPPATQTDATAQTTPGATLASKVTMLLPLSGKQEQLGLAMQNAATLALSDLGYASYELSFEDTQSTPAGARAAATRAVDGGANLLLGPVFADEARSAGAVAAEHKINLIAFSTDAAIAGNNTYVMGILPQDQARHIAGFANARGVRQVLVIAPRNAYGELVVKQFSGTAAQNGISILGPVWLDQGVAGLPAQLARLTQTQGLQPDAVFLPFPADQTVQILPMIPQGTRKPLILGTGLWDDADMVAYPSLIGAYYAAPAPQSRTRFEQIYARQFGAKPPRIASLGYDAVALSVVVGKLQGPSGYNAPALESTSGYSGIDGPFRFAPGGVVQRQLSVLQLQPGARIVAAPAASNF